MKAHAFRCLRDDIHAVDFVAVGSMPKEVSDFLLPAYFDAESRSAKVFHDSNPVIPANRGCMFLLIIPLSRQFLAKISSTATLTTGSEHLRFSRAVAASRDSWTTGSRGQRSFVRNHMASTAGLNFGEG